MSHHAHGYRIYPDDNKKIPNEVWIKADFWINGFAFKRDFKEAVALAKIGARSCGIPFIVHEVAIGGIKPSLSDAWLIK